MTRRLTRPLSVALAAVMLAASPAWAHLMPAQQGTLNVLGNAVFAALSLPVSVFAGADDDGDGRLSAAELRAHEAMLRTEIARHVHITDGDAAGSLDLVMPMAEPDERDSTSATGSTHVLVLLKVTFRAPPTSLRIATDAFGPLAGERQLTIKATRDGAAEVAILSPVRGEHRFFRAPAAILDEYVAVGVEHILFGADHLLFLLTIVVAAAGWRYWLGVVTSFTVAHSITLTLSLLGTVRAPAGLVEPMIAASIVLMAVLNLRGGPVVPRHRMAIVFACGLLHGLGFASAISAMGLDGADRLASVVGFNVGIELGQGAFLLAMLACVSAVRALRAAAVPTGSAHRWQVANATSLIACIVGAFWFVQRVATAM